LIRKADTAENIVAFLARNPGTSFVAVIDARRRHDPVRS
jgi:hypothetical protein